MQRTKKSCRFYNSGYCKFGINCQYKHDENLLTLPIDVINIILDGQYLSDIRQVCRRLQRHIDSNYPILLFIFTGVMNGCYTSGCAVSIARCFNDAVFQISLRALNSNSFPSCRYGTWSIHDRECRADFKIGRWDDVAKYLSKDTDFKHFEYKFYKTVLCPKYKVNSASGNESNVTITYPKRYSKEEKIECYNIYFELRDKKVNILPLDKCMGFYNGGGS